MSEYTEIKNINSFDGMEKAIHAETLRQTLIKICGGEIPKVTLNWHKLVEWADNVEPEIIEALVRYRHSKLPKDETNKTA